MDDDGVGWLGPKFAVYSLGRDGILGNGLLDYNYLQTQTGPSKMQKWASYLRLLLLPT